MKALNIRRHNDHKALPKTDRLVRVLKSVNKAPTIESIAATSAPSRKTARLSTIKGGNRYCQDGAFLKAIRERDNYTCQICGKPAKDVDHIIPYRISGETRPDGVRVLCHSCNCKRKVLNKCALTYDEWIAKLEAEYDAYLREQATEPQKELIAV